ncbi:MAG: MurR/RpiR family transcriptional regulator [Firmicutes bacterium]|nr:MurR/RpiR family transcriptional regulator [Bacillota bacterium]
MPSSDLIELLVNRSKPAKIFIKMASARPFLNEAELAIADYILAFPQEAARCTAQQLAERTGTSEASVFRFCHTFGVAGFTALRDILKQATAAAESISLSPITEADNWDDSVQAAIMAILGTAIVLKPDVLTNSAKAVASSSSVNVYGMGPISARLAEMLSFRLQSAGIPSFAWVDSRAGNLPDDFIGPNDSAIGISHSGTNKQVAEFLARARRNGAATIALTNYPASKVGSSAEYILSTGVWEDSFQMLEFLPRIAELLILSCFVQQVNKYRSADSSLPSFGQSADHV